ncbi:MAG: magnetochrome domain-containing protein [Rhodospirillaceae bacterium]
MTSEDLDLDGPAVEEYPDDCARGLRKYLFVMALVVVGTLSGTFWYRMQPAVALATAAHPTAYQPMNVPVPGMPVVAQPMQMAGAPNPMQPVAMTAAIPGALPDFAAVVNTLRGAVVSVGRSRPENRFGFNPGVRVGGGEPAQQQQVAAGTPAPAADGGVQFATPVAGAVLESIGTGFIIRNDGYILTNFHVVRGNESMVVTVFDDAGAQRYPANIVKLDAAVDLALLKIEPRAPLMVAPLGDSDQVSVADEVIAIGSPFGLDLTVSRGIISAKRKSLVIEGTVHRDLLQTDAAINQGNSGGPLVNRAAEVVGINTAIYTPTGAFAGVGFAVPSNQAKLFLAEELVLQAAQPAASVPGGLWSVPVAQTAATAGLAGPAILAGVAAPHADGRENMDCAICHQLLPRPGARAGATPMVRSIPAAAPQPGMAPPIMKGATPPHRDGRETMNCAMCHQFLPTGGAPVARSFPVAAAPPIMRGAPAPHRDGREAMSCTTCHQYLPAGGATAAPVAQTGGAGGGLQFARPPSTLALNVAVPPPGSAQMTAGAAPQGGFVILGATTLPITAALAAQIGQTEGKGVFVASVVPGSPAAVAGLESGMVIEKIDGKRLRSPRELFTALEAAKTGDTLRLSVTGDKGRRELRLIASVMPASTMAVPAPMPGAPAAKAATVPTEFNWRGMEIETFAAVAAPGTGGAVQLKGAVIAEVIPGSPAQRAGLQANDIILEINSQPTGTAAMMNKAMQAATGKREVMMKMARSNREFFVVLP